MASTPARLDNEASSAMDGTEATRRMMIGSSASAYPTPIRRGAKTPRWMLRERANCPYEERAAQPGHTGSLAWQSTSHARGSVHSTRSINPWSFSTFTNIGSSGLQAK